MAGLYQRVASRGFPSSVAAGMTGAGALESQGGPTDPSHGNTADTGKGATLTGFQPDTPAPVEVELLTGTWGLSGQIVNPDQTPGGHAAPFPGRAGSYAPSDELDAMHQRSMEIHSVDFGALANRRESPESINLTQAQISTEYSENTGEAVGLVPLTGPQRVLGGVDAVQGYDVRNRYGFDGGHRQRTVFTDPQPMSFLDSAERVFIVPQAGPSFMPTDAVQGPEPVGTFLNAGSVNATAQTTYEPVPNIETSPGEPQAGPVSSGWWG